MKVAGIARILFEVFAKVQNKVIDGSRSGVYLIAPYGLQDLFAGYYLIFIFDQQF
jgi:hypothetical protein